MYGVRRVACGVCALRMSRMVWLASATFIIVGFAQACGRVPTANNGSEGSPAVSTSPTSAPTTSPATSPSPCASSVQPSPRGLEAVAYSPALGQIMLFGGSSNTSNDTFGDTWIWHNGCWDQLSPVASPSPRQGMVAANDANSGRVLAYGGFYQAPGSVQGSVYSDTWQWDGATWKQLSTAGPRVQGRLVFDPTLKAVLLVGLSQLATMETWTWNGSAWERLNPVHSPSNRVQFGLAGDSFTGQVVLFGGFNEGSGFLGDTWIWDGKDWTQKAAPGSPSPRVDAAMAVDAGVQVLILFGGNGPSRPARDTWGWDGNQWSQLEPDQTQFTSSTLGLECGSHACLVQSGREVWQWQGTSWVAAS